MKVKKLDLKEILGWEQTIIIYCLSAFGEVVLKWSAEVYMMLPMRLQNKLFKLCASREDLVLADHGVSYSPGARDGLVVV